MALHAIHIYKVAAIFRDMSQGHHVRVVKSISDQNKKNNNKSCWGKETRGRPTQCRAVLIGHFERNEKKKVKGWEEVGSAGVLLSTVIIGEQSAVYRCQAVFPAQK